MPSSGRWMALFAGEFRRLRAASDFARGGKVTKTPPGTAQDGHFVSIFAFPRTPVYGETLLCVGAYGRRAKMECLGAVPPGPLGPGERKISAMRFRFCAWVSQLTVREAAAGEP